MNSTVMQLHREHSNGENGHVPLLVDHYERCYSDDDDERNDDRDDDWEIEEVVMRCWRQSQRHKTELMDACK